MHKIDNYTIGSDIEVFIQNKETGKFISAAGDQTNDFITIVPGTKTNPYYINDEKTFAIETDNVSIEFLVPPTNNKDNFRENIQYMMNYIEKTLPAGLVPVAKASQEFEFDQLIAEQTKTFGCDRDFNAWTRNFNPKPDTNTNIRSNGFHIHVGYDKPNRRTSIELIKAMDLFIGLGSLKLDPDTNRRSLYGKAGACRFKPYGVEYRVLSSELINSSESIDWVFNSTINAINYINSGSLVSSDLSGQIQDIINNSKVEESIKLTQSLVEKTMELIK